MLLLGGAICGLFGGAASAEAPTPSASLQPDGIDAGQLYVGQYLCHTPAWLLLHIEMVKATGLRGGFQFLGDL